MSENAKWYVIHTYSGYENAVKAAIEKAVTNRGFEDMVLQTEIPLETVTEVNEVGVVEGSGAQGVPRLCAAEDGADR